MDLTAWDIKESEIREDAPQHEKLKFLLRYAILAPSGHNTQPWKFAVDDDGIKVFVDLSRAHDQFNSITKRHTNRSVFEDKPSGDSIRVDFFTGKEINTEIAYLAEKAELGG